MASEKLWTLYAASLDRGAKVKQKNRSFLQSVGKKTRYSLTERAMQTDGNVWFYRAICAEGSCLSYRVN